MSSNKLEHLRFAADDPKQALRRKVMRRREDKARHNRHPNSKRQQLAPEETDEAVLDIEEIVETTRTRGISVSLDQVDPSVAISPNIKALFERMETLGITANTERFGQHFLVDEADINQLVQAANIEEGDHVIEIGAGPGNLTRQLANICRATRNTLLTAIERDSKFSPFLEELKREDDLDLVWGDAIEELPKVVRGPGNKKVVANIPYHILEPLLLELHRSRSVTMAVLLIGRNYAERAVADYHEEDPIGPRFSRTSLFSQARFSPEIIADVPREKFIPEPRTQSSIVRLGPRTKKDGDLLEIANIIARGKRLPVRVLMQKLLAGNYNRQHLNGIKSWEEARQFTDGDFGLENSSGLSEDILNSSVTTLDNDQLHRVLLKIDHLKKQRRQRCKHKSRNKPSDED